VAAELTVQRIVQEVTNSDGQEPLKILEAGIHSASQAIASRSASRADQAGMGSTCACAWIQGDRLYTAHVGDSRIYLVRGGRFT
jgi:protein phosphatase